ncbi:ParB N-terminal domain-containing protein [Jonesiaceae bacterium BS-20]|uniref:ParB N-terminal domain-containing protein n=1 Tax=Jonesiaceae bacterium BS-20 TaxID=3120821 RepID=A0AAU7DTU3_9MICO
MSSPTPVVTRHEMDPATLEIEPNVRKTVDLSKSFLASIEALGVITPVIVKSSPTGGYSVVDGQRRTLAAVQVGLSLIPVTLIETIRDDADLISTQIVVNDERAQVSAWETAQGIKQLSLLGVPAGQIQKRTGKSKAVVAAALELTEALKNVAIFDAVPEIDLVRAATVSGFADEDLREKLLAHAHDDDFDHHVAAAEQEVLLRVEEAAKASELEKAGYYIFKDYKETNTPEVADLWSLSASAGGTQIKVADHLECPGRAVRLRRTWQGELEEDHYCSTWKTAGHFKRHAEPSSGSTSGPKTEEEKGVRRHVVEMNKLAEVALVVHEAWLTEFFQRDQRARPRTLMPHALTVFNAACSYGVNPTRTDGAVFVSVEITAEASERQAVWSFVALAFGAVHRKMSREFWRDDWQKKRALPLLAAMVEWGYAPAPFEKAMLDGVDVSDPAVFTPGEADVSA